MPVPLPGFLLLAASAAFASRAAASQAPPSTPGARADERRPNVVLILADDMGYGDLGVHGNPVIRTPALDAMAARSVAVRNFYVSPVCAPTRAALLTGCYPQRFGVGQNGYPMQPEAVTLAELLRDAGWATGIFGKWHLGDHYPHRPMDQGFETSLVSRGGIVGQLSDDPVEVRYTDPFLMRDGERVATKGYATDVYFDAALEWIESVHANGESFFLYLPTNAPHGPFTDVPADLFEHYRAQDLGNGRFPQEAGHALPPATPDALEKLASVYAMVEKIDRNVGRLVRRLEEMEIAERTIVLFLSDNGPNGPRYNAGMRGVKGSVYEGGIRSPLFVLWPGTLPARGAVEPIAAHVDVLPTILDLVGVAVPEGLDGRSLRPLLEGAGENWPERRLFFQANQGNAEPRNNFAVRTPRWKLVQNGGFHSDDLSLARHARKSREEREPAFELYDMLVDPLETNDVRKENPDVVKELRKAYERKYLTLYGLEEEERAPLGAPQENPVLLTRDNWKRARWDPRAAVWKVRVARDGTYDVRFRFEPADERRSALLTLGDLEERRELSRNASTCVFEGLELERGHAKLGAWVEGRAGEQWSVWQVEVERRP